jgi:putative ABC transport system permease protein
MYSLELANQLLKELWKRKLRTILGIFGIFWGTASVVLLLALGSGYYAASVKNLSSIAGGAMMFFPGTTNLPYKGYPSGRKVIIKSSQLVEMGKRIHGIKHISPTLSGGVAAITFMNNTTNRDIQGVNWSYADIWKLNNKVKGDFISNFNVQQRLFVTVLGESVAKALFKGESAVGKTVRIWGIPFVVVGVLTDTGGSGGGGWLTQKVFIPYTSLIVIKGDLDVGQFSVYPNNVDDVPDIKRQIRDYLGGELTFNPVDKGALNSPDLTKLMRYFTLFFMVIQIFLGFCGLLTLIVGGVSIANMMFLIVTERTREIGLRMALGAKRKNILFLVMLETTLIVAIGGIAGIVFSKLVVVAFDWVHLPSWIGHPQIHAWTIGVTLLILFVVTFLAGIFPARSASRMQPVEALCF